MHFMHSMCFIQCLSIDRLLKMQNEDGLVRLSSEAQQALDKLQEEAMQKLQQNTGQLPAFNAGRSALQFLIILDFCHKIGPNILQQVS